MRKAVSLPRLRKLLAATGASATPPSGTWEAGRVVAESPLPGASFDVRRADHDHPRGIDEAPRPMACGCGARVGERVRWYEVPEEVGH